MRKNFNIEELKKTNPFKTPDGYFDTLASRVMSQIPEEIHESASTSDSKKKAKVVGMIPRKRNNGWVKWAAGIAACVCGLALFLTNKPDEDATKQVAMSKIPITTVSDDADASSTVQEKVQVPTAKQYANNSIDLSSRHKRSTYVAEPRQKYTAYVPTERKVVASATATDFKKSDVPSKPVVPRNNEVTSNIASNTITISASDIDKVNNEYDLLDYTQMGGSDIYDYLAGSEYY